jgi:hypothetical protein
MFGHTENQFKVLESHTRASRRTPGATVHYEIRQDVRGESLPYIAAYSKNADGTLLADHLLIYTRLGALREDWAKLRSPGLVSVGQLQFDEAIENHHVGRTKDGALVMC